MSFYEFEDSGPYDDPDVLYEIRERERRRRGKRKCLMCEEDFWPDYDDQMHCSDLCLDMDIIENCSDDF